MSYGTRIDDIEIPNRAYNALNRAGITHVRMIQEMTDEDLLSIRNFGTSCLRAVRNAVPKLPDEVPFPLTDKRA